MAIEGKERRGPKEEGNERSFKIRVQGKQNLLLLLLSTCIHTRVGRFLDFSRFRSGYKIKFWTGLVRYGQVIRLSSRVVWSGQVIFVNFERSAWMGEGFKVFFLKFALGTSTGHTYNPHLFSILNPRRKIFNDPEKLPTHPPRGRPNRLLL
jgi:hypothetical protein